jgi:hypothetical protein
LPVPGLDSSWNVALQLALLKKLQFGKDIVFTFGPLGFLYMPVYCNICLWMISCIFTLFAHFLLFYSVVLLLARSKVTVRGCIIIAVVLVWAVPYLEMQYKVSLTALILMYLAVTRQISDVWSWPVFLGVPVLLAIISLHKLTGMVMSLSLLVSAVPFLMYQKQFKYVVSMVACPLFMYQLL